MKIHRNFLSAFVNVIRNKTLVVFILVLVLALCGRISADVTVREEMHRYYLNEELVALCKCSNT